MRRSVVAGLAAMTLLTACSQDSESQADCSQRVRLDGVTYTGWSATGLEAQPLGDAERSSCDDNGPDPKGAYFADEPERVRVWSFDGYSPDEVLGVRLDKSSYTIFVAESLSSSERDALVRELRRAGT